MSHDSTTWIGRGRKNEEVMHVRMCRFEIVAGPDTGRVEELALPQIRIGRAGTDLLVTDRAVSGVHAEITLTETGYRLRDLESSNGTFINGVRVRDGFLQPGDRVSVGRTTFQFVPLSGSAALPLWQESKYVTMVGRSWAMRRLFELIEHVAASDAAVLVTGETGSGKELVAEAIHERSHRSGRPFVVLDCGAVPPPLLEDQLFGHERGAFTGATYSRAGVFEAASGGTLFLDELGELPIDLQPKLLRAVETGTVRRLGGTATVHCDVRLVAATNRDLPVEVNRGRFRADLYYRLAVIRVEVPPLRERLEVLEILVEDILAKMPGAARRGLPEDFLERARGHSWPGNVRELRNAVEQAVTAPDFLELGNAPANAPLWNIDIGEPFKIAKQRFIDEFDRRFITALLQAHDWNITGAARATGIDRMAIYKIMQRLGMGRSEVSDDGG
jgi:transcriptional regulator with GAF, ATPase, and Fis domain